MDENTLEAVHRVMLEISETKASVKKIRDMAKDVMEQNDEYRELQEEVKEMTAKRQKIKKLLESDKDYQKIASELDELRFKLKDLGEILSHHLVTYYNETQNTEITDPNGETHTINLSARIGRI